MTSVDVGVTNTHPLIMHSPQGVDPTHPLVIQLKALTSKRKKTESDVAQIDWLSYQLALYWSAETAVYVPDVAVLGCIREGAKVNRRGRDIESGVDITETEIPLIYDGPRDPEALYAARFVDRRSCGLQQNRVMRVRPRFNTWALNFRLVIDDDLINPSDVHQALTIGGLRKGLLDYRPRFGRFEIASWKASNGESR